MRVKERKDGYRVMVGKPERKEPLGRQKRIWENNIKMDLNVLICLRFPTCHS
jgi:hypothetical protein